MRERSFRVSRSLTWLGRIITVGATHNSSRPVEGQALRRRGNLRKVAISQGANSYDGRESIGR